MARAVRAFLFASATAATFRPQRFSVAAAHRLRRSVRRESKRTEERAPWMSSTRRYRSPGMLMPGSFGRRNAILEQQAVDLVALPGAVAHRHLPHAVHLLGVLLLDRLHAHKPHA